jgi:hypothetical protein
MGVESSAARIRTVRALHGQLSLPTLEAQRSAGAHIHRELDEAERLRHDLLDARTDPRHFPPSVAGRLLSVWNAYVLQTVGEHLLDTVRYRTFGTVRAEVASLILEFLGPAERWMYQARRAAADPSYRVEENIDLPAEPPAWPDQRYRPYPLSAAMATAAQEIHATGDSILADLARSLVPRGADLFRLQEILDNAAAAIEAAMGPQNALGFPASTAIHLRYALRTLFLFGQSAAMPALLDTQDRVTVVSLVSHVPSRVDPWCLTDPCQRNGWRSLPTARAAIERLWTEDASPMVTARVQVQIDAARRSGAIVFAMDQAGERLGSFYRCPWPAIYEVRRPVTIGGTRLLPMQQFTFDVLGEAHSQGAPYAHGIVVSVFVSVFVPADAVGRRRGDRERRPKPERWWSLRAYPGSHAVDGPRDPGVPSRSRPRRRRGTGAH